MTSRERRKLCAGTEETKVTISSGTIDRPEWNFVCMCVCVLRSGNEKNTPHGANITQF